GEGRAWRGPRTAAPPRACPASRVLLGSGRAASRSPRAPPGLLQAGSCADPIAASVRLCIVDRQLVAVGSAARQNGCPAAGGERDRLVDRVPERESVRQPRGEAVTAAVGAADPSPHPPPPQKP